MAGDKDQFFTLEMKDGGTVTFGDNGKGKIIGIGKIKITPFTFIENVLLVDKLKHNLLSISQLCDRGFKVLFESSMCIVSSSLDSCIQFVGHRLGNVYMVDLNDLAMRSTTSLMATNAKIKETSTLWHRRLGHASLHTISKLISKDLVKGLPKLKIEFNSICDACQLGKQTRESFKSKNVVSTSRPLELLHMDLFGPTRTTSLGGKKYGLVIVDDFSRFTWVLFLTHKNEVFELYRVCNSSIEHDLLFTFVRKNLKLCVRHIQTPNS